MSRFAHMLRRLARCRAGASAVEFAIVALPLFLTTFAIIEYGRAMWVRQAIIESAVAGARCMGVVQTECATNGSYDAARALQFVEKQAKGWSVTLADAQVSLDRAAVCAGIGGFSSVKIEYRFSTVVPGLMEGLSGSVPLSASACFPNQT